MDGIQVVVTVLSSSVVGGVVVKLIDVAREAMAGRMQKRRDEVDRATAELEKAQRKIEDLKSRVLKEESHSDILEESLRIHRRIIIDAPCLSPESLPSFPHRSID